MTERTRSLNELAEDASALVRAMEALKAHIDSYNNAEEKLNSASESLSGLAVSISKQVQQSEKIIEETSKVSIHQMNQWLQALYSEAKLNDAILELKGGRKDISDGFNSTLAGFDGLYKGESNKEKLESITKQLDEVRENMLDKFTFIQAGLDGLYSKIEKNHGSTFENANAVSKNLENINNTVSNQLIQPIEKLEKKIKLMNLILIVPFFFSVLGVVLGFLD